MAEQQEVALDTEGVLEIYDPATHFGMTNIAELIDEKYLDEQGHLLSDLIREDEESREGAMAMADEWLKLATQVVEAKTTPWSGASNVKYPLMTMACINFHSRALPALVVGDKPVLCSVKGRDPKHEKRMRADRVSRFMSYQVTQQMEEWTPDMDRMLFVLPIVGLCFKKTTFSPSLRRIKSELLLPNDVIVNYHAKGFERARMTQKIELDPNEYVELVREGLFLDTELEKPERGKVTQNMRDQANDIMLPAHSEETPYLLYESHCWLDLDDDGYKEPYVVTLDSVSEKIVRIVPRWKESDFITNENQEVIKIKAENYFTAYQFFPDPNSAVSGIGFGHLLGPTNAAVNTIINQLVDSGTLNNMGGGFLGRGAKIKGGAIRFRPGEWKITNTTGDDLRKSIFPMPVAQPSSVLMNLLQLLLASGEDIGRSTDMMKGNNPGQNQKVGTTMAVLQEGMKVYSSIYKRLHRSLTKEFQQLFELNREYASQEEYEELLDYAPSDEEIEAMLPPETPPEQVEQAKELSRQQRYATTDDFNPEDLNIFPTSEAELVTDSMKAQRAASLLEKLQMGLQINRTVATRQVLEAEGHTNIDELMEVPQPPPSIEERELLLATLKESREENNNIYDRILKLAQAEAIEPGQQMEAYKAAVDGIDKQLNREQAERQNAQQNGNTQP